MCENKFHSFVYFVYFMILIATSREKCVIISWFSAILAAYDFLYYY
jgi:hypothetical protein